MKLLILLCSVLPVMSREIGSFIIGGTNSNIALYPHQLSLRVDGFHDCGASLISQTRAVSAAHCVARPLSSYSILGGATDRTDTTGPTSVLFKPTKISAHPNYVNDGNLAFPNDIAVLIFDPVQFNINFQPIELASPNNGDFVGAECVITGWGLTDVFVMALPNVLQQATMTVMSEDDCAKKVYPLNAGHICVTAPTSGSCSADSGGPLVCGNKLVGATSFGNYRCSPTIGPSVYSRISYFYDWIAAQ